MANTLAYTDTLQVIECGNCHISFAIPRSMYRNRVADGQNFWCPNGCKISCGEGENARLKRQLQSVNVQVTHERDQRRAAERSASAYKGQATRIRKRVAAGVCPCCKRTFQNLARHMDGQHPGFGASDA